MSAAISRRPLTLADLAVIEALPDDVREVVERYAEQKDRQPYSEDDLCHALRDAEEMLRSLRRVVDTLRDMRDEARGR